MKLSYALLAAPALAFAPQAQQRPSVKVEARKEVAAAALGAAALLAPLAAFAGDIESGATLFAGNCAACHAGGNNVIVAEKTLRKEALDSYLAGGRKESSVVTQVTNGKNAMPAFGGRLSDEEIGDVAAYVIDQANGAKWDE
jgi:cytochrome c6